jgi:nucleoside-diphosphate-sugar epimerase
MAEFKRVAVTGASGFLASELIKQLLEKGYTVHATSTSDLSNIKAIAACLPGTLHAFPVSKNSSSDITPLLEAFSGCSYVFHTSAPCIYETDDDPEDQLIQPTITSTIDILRACSAATVKRVILTSCTMAIKGLHPSPPIAASSTSSSPIPLLYTEEDWNTTSTIDNGEACFAAKTIQENAAWDFARENNIDLVTILPGDLMIGPVMFLSTASKSTSIGYIKMLLETNTTTSNNSSGEAVHKESIVYCDVRDVARVHIAAAETPSAHGRYIVANTAPTPTNTILKWHLEQQLVGGSSSIGKQPPPTTPNSNNSEDIYNISKVEKELGIHLTLVKTTVLDMLGTLYAIGIVTTKE